MADQFLRIKIDAQALQQLRGAAVHFAVIDHAQAVELFATHPDVLGDAHVRHQVEFLMNHRDPGLQGRQRPIKGDGLATQPQLPRVGLVDTGDDFHQRGLARAVLPHQRQHGARSHAQLHVIQGNHTREALADIHHFQQVGRLRRGGRGGSRHGRGP